MDRLIILVFISLIFIAGCQFITGEVIYDSDKLTIQQDNITIKTYFCPRDDCQKHLLDLVKESYDIKCAFYDLDLPDLIKALDDKSNSIPVKLVVDNGNKKGLENLTFAKFDNNNQLMHNKFCIFIINGKKVLTTGSHNPTLRDTYKNNNNLLVIESNYLVENYEQEFSELWGGSFGKGLNALYPRLNSSDIIIENYFCPDDGCENAVARTLSQAKFRIYFMTYSFTSDEIGSILINKTDKNIDVKGVMEKIQVSNYSEYHRLRENGVDVILDHNKYNMHHKVFIVDDILITGSYNPTSSGNNRNDENLLIIHDPVITDLFLEEFYRVRRGF